MDAKFIIGLLLSVIGNLVNASKNFFDKRLQLLLAAIAVLVWLIEYIFIYPSKTYIIVFAFTLIYLLAYRYKKELLRLFKVDIMFVLMVLFIILVACVVMYAYEGVDSIAGIVIMFLDIFAVFLFTSQGLRYKNCLVALLYTVIDMNLGNYFAVFLNMVNFIIPIITIVQHRKEKIIDTEGIKEYYELINFTKEIRRIKKQKDF